MNIDVGVDRAEVLAAVAGYVAVHINAFKDFVCGNFGWAGFNEHVDPFRVSVGKSHYYDYANTNCPHFKYELVWVGDETDSNSGFQLYVSGRSNSSLRHQRHFTVDDFSNDKNMRRCIFELMAEAIGAKPWVDDNGRL